MKKLVLALCISLLITSCGNSESTKIDEAKKTMKVEATINAKKLSSLEEAEQMTIKKEMLAAITTELGGTKFSNETLKTTIDKVFDEAQKKYKDIDLVEYKAEVLEKFSKLIQK